MNRKHRLTLAVFIVLAGITGIVAADHVIEPPESDVDNISINADGSLGFGETKSYTVDVNYENGTSESITFHENTSVTSNDTTVVTVDEQDGTYSAESQGTAELNATFEGKVTETFAEVSKGPFEESHKEYANLSEFTVVDGPTNGEIRVTCRSNGADEVFLTWYNETSDTVEQSQRFSPNCDQTQSFLDAVSSATYHVKIRLNTTDSRLVHRSDSFSPVFDGSEVPTRRSEAFYIQNLTFDHEQGNPNITFTGHDTFNVTNITETEQYDSFNATRSDNVSATNGQLQLAERSTFNVTTIRHTDTLTLFDNVDHSAGGLTWKPDGTKLYVVVDEEGLAGQKIYQYDVSVPYDMSTAALNQTGAIDSEVVSPEGIAWKDDGAKVYVVGNGDDNITEYTTGADYSVGSLTVNHEKNISSESNLPNDIVWNDDGTKLYVSGDSNDNIYEYALSVAFDLSTATFSQKFSASNVGSVAGVDWNNDGTEMYIAGEEKFFEYNVSTPFDVTTATLLRSQSISGVTTFARGIEWDDNGTNVYTLEDDFGFQFNATRAKFGSYERKYTADNVTDGKLNWTETVGTGEQTAHFIRTNGNAYVNVTNDENVFKDLTKDDNIWVKEELTGAGTAPVVNDTIDGFEDGDLSEYTEDAGNGRYEAEDTGFIKEGTFSLHGYLATDDANNITSQSGLNEYPAKGDTFQFWVRLGNSSGGNRINGGLMFGRQNGSQWYRVDVESGNDDFDLRYKDGTDNAILASNNVNVPQGHWLRVKIEWDDQNDLINGTLINGSSGNTIAEFSVDNDSYTSGGIGMNHRTPDADTHIYYDGIKVLNGTTEPIDSPEIDNYTLEYTENQTLITEDPSVQFAADNASFTGTLSDGQSTIIDRSNFSAGTYRAEIHTKNLTGLQWSYDGLAEKGTFTTFTSTQTVTVGPAEPTSATLTIEQDRIPRNDTGSYIWEVTYENGTTLEHDPGNITSNETNVLVAFTNGTLETFDNASDTVNVTANQTINGVTVEDSDTVTVASVLLKDCRFIHPNECMLASVSNWTFFWLMLTASVAALATTVATSHDVGVATATAMIGIGWSMTISLPFVVDMVPTFMFIIWIFGVAAIYAVDL